MKTNGTFSSDFKPVLRNIKKDFCGNKEGWRNESNILVFIFAAGYNMEVQIGYYQEISN